MNNSIKKLIEDSLIKVSQEIKKKGIGWESLPPIFISQPKKKEWGDLSTNFPFLLSRSTGESASKIGRLLTLFLKDEDFLSHVEFVPPGWINFFISRHYLEETLKKVITQEKKFTYFSEGEGKKIQMEFVSANPTGPLHIGHGRAAAFGDSLANILSKMGYSVK
ncbi:MAG: arginine--tRNA ligase, partial [Candidatus Aerophobetes bacterium]|nr:arginine--tRNA ligase [Candidatus Aerophobetes bacterium]